MAELNNEPQILTLPVDLLKNITNNLEPTEEKALQQTCRRMKFLIAEPPKPAHHLLSVSENIPQRDGRSTPIPQSPMPWKAAQKLEEIEQENREVDDRDEARGMELSDTEDGYAGTDDGRSNVGGNSKPTKIKGKKNILTWATDLGSAPVSPSPLRSPSAASFTHSPRARPESPSPGVARVPSFKLTTL